MVRHLGSFVLSDRCHCRIVEVGARGSTNGSSSSGVSVSLSLFFFLSRIYFHLYIYFFSFSSSLPFRFFAWVTRSIWVAHFGCTYTGDGFIAVVEKSFLYVYIEVREEEEVWEEGEKEELATFMGSHFKCPLSSSWSSFWPWYQI